MSTMTRTNTLTTGRLPRSAPWALLGLSWIAVGAVFGMLLASGAAHELGTPLASLSVALGDWRQEPAIAATYCFVLWRWAFGPADRALFGKMPSAEEATLPNVGSPVR